MELLIVGKRSVLKYEITQIKLIVYISKLIMCLCVKTFTTS